MPRLFRNSLAAVSLLVAPPASAQEAHEGVPPRLVVGQTVEGVIADGDPLVETQTLVTRYTNAPTVGRQFRLELDEPGPVTIELWSYFFDAYLVLRDAEGELLAEDDDGLTGTHSRLVVRGLEPGTTYRLEACALHGRRGPFDLVLKRGEPPADSAASRAALELEDAERRVEVVEAIEGRDGPGLARALDDLGLIHDRRGAYDQARPCWERALAIREEALGPAHPDTATSLNQLAVLLKNQGDLAGARPLYERALAIREEALGPEHPDTATSLNNQATLLAAQGHFAAARPLYERALTISEEVLGPEHPDTASFLNNLAALLERQGDFAAARLLLERAFAIWEEALGPEHPLTASSLNNLAALLERQGDFAAARPLLERAFAIWEEALGPEHPDTARSLNNLAALLERQGDFAAARPLLERALAIYEQALGPEHPSTARSLNNLAVLLERQGDFAAARPLFERALAIREEALGPEHPDTAHSLNSLALLLQDLGDSAAARPLFERALAIREEALGPEHPDTATSLNNLATLLAAQGHFAAARPLFERALAIRKEALGPEHPGTAGSLSSLAGLLRIQGDYAAARPLLERALAIYEKVLGSEHPETAASLNHLAALLLAQGDSAAARPLFERALTITEQTFGPEHPTTAAFLNNLASLLKAQGDFAAARPLYERALAINKKALGPEHPDTATSLNNLAALLERLGNFAAVHPLLERALAIREEALGPEHHDTAHSLNRLAMLLGDLGEPRQAWELVHRAQLDRKDRIEATLASLSEGERYPYLAQLLWQLELQISIARQIDEPGVRVRAYDALLEWKGRVGRLVTASREQLAARMGAEERALVEELRRCQAELSRLALATEIRDREVRDRRLGELRAERGRLERELQRSAGWPGGAESVGMEAVGFEALRSSLEPGAALLDFFAHRLYRPGGGGQGTWDPERFTVWITRRDGDKPIDLDLGPASEIEAAAKVFLEDLVARRGVATAVEEGGDPGAALRALLWDPIAPHLGGIETVFVSPDGALGTLPFETLPLEDGSPALERFAFVYLQDATSLARPDEADAELGSLLAVGGVDFRESSDWDRAEASTGGEDLRATVDVGPADSSPRGSFTDYWGRLPATEYESQVVADMHEDAFGSDGRRLLLQGGEPSEQRLKHELERHAVLHLATHGYFQPEGMPSMWEAAKDAAGRLEMRMSDEARHLVGKHPGLLSGLVCAGANRSGEPEGDDGYLTAEEVGWLDLSGAELVVLSACETGLGRPQSGEGLIGLRRAFQTAGAKTVISSLWSVKDESTAELMRDFYKNLFLKGMGRHEALRAAQLAMLQRNRMEHGEALPSTWGAFVLSGEWR